MAATPTRPCQVLTWLLILILFSHTTTRDVFSQPIYTDTISNTNTTQPEQHKQTHNAFTTTYPTLPHAPHKQPTIPTLQNPLTHSPTQHPNQRISSPTHHSITPQHDSTSISPVQGRLYQVLDTSSMRDEPAKQLLGCSCLPDRVRGWDGMRR